MKATRRALTGLLVIAVLVAGCSAAAHLKALQPSSLAARTAPAAPMPHTGPVPKPAIQLGAGVDLYSYRHANFTKASTAEAAYLTALHANSVMVSFPFFMHGERASRVYAKTATPTPAQLAVFARTMARAGLYVSLRPLLDETSLGEPRNVWRPRAMRAWFASYQRFLIPYARMAQRVGIPKLYVGTEFQYFGSAPEWTRLDNAVRRVYHGILAYANNGHRLHRGTGGTGVRLSADSYPDMPTMPVTATVARLTAAWEAWDQVMPRGTVLSEVGIAGVRGAYHRPWVHQWPRPVIDPAVQVRWFTAACDAAAREHLGGIYFWAIGFGAAELDTPLSVRNQAAWETGPAQRAVAACFQRLGRR